MLCIFFIVIFILYMGILTLANLLPFEHFVCIMHPFILTIPNISLPLCLVSSSRGAHVH